ncbi:hypothetical protein BO221_43145 [Archangium sp. Cb G35]|uniref:patatin-like phospholipase family protein n=1 Tax=Archangium sp. Cb G35 TaxID=1920190 RepID=UPI000936A42D|nr:patatin-like phospholipase family protein [Archangium sp. Cb G35]OJT17802.1 hypothetical protein BO221_43145 [Archangium sp. Cb G35]
MRKPRHALTLLLGSALFACATTPQHALEQAQPLPEDWNHGYVPAPLSGYKSAQERSGQEPQCALAVAISGGGTISAAFSYGVLEQLNKSVELPHGQSVLKEIDYLSTASGGGITASIFIDMLREHSLRQPRRKPTRDDLSFFFEHARFRGVMDWKFVKDIDVFPKGIFSSPAELIYDNMGPALTGQEALPCKQLDLRTSTDRPGCYLSGINRLKFSDLLVAEGTSLAPQWPIWLPGTTLYTTGTHIPAIPSTFHALGIDGLDLVSSDSPSAAHWVRLEDMDYHHALVLSMAFPGIGPLVARTRTDSKPQYVLLADGGQSDNLGLVNGIMAVANDVKAHPDRNGLVIVIDGAMQPSDASVSAWPGSEGSLKDRLLSGRFGMVFANGAPPLGFNRQAAESLANGLLSELGAETRQRIRVVFVRASNLLNSPEPITFHDVGNCITTDGRRDPLGKSQCLEGAPTVSIAARDRIQIRVASLSIGRRLSEDLITLGNEAVKRYRPEKPSEEGLEQELLRCLQSTARAARAP